MDELLAVLILLVVFLECFDELEVVLDKEDLCESIYASDGGRIPSATTLGDSDDAHVHVVRPILLSEAMHSTS